jgi:hypothetical protein
VTRIKEVGIVIVFHVVSGVIETAEKKHLVLCQDCTMPGKNFRGSGAGFQAQPPLPTPLLLTLSVAKGRQRSSAPPSRAWRGQVATFEASSSDFTERESPQGRRSSVQISRSDHEDVPPPLPYLPPYRSPYCMPVAPRHHQS